MQKAIEKFRYNIASVKDLEAIYSLLVENHQKQSKEILRAVIVLTVSALDCFIHDLIKQGMIETYQGNRFASKQFEAYQIPFKFLKLIETSTQENDKLGYLEDAIREGNSKDTYQSPKGIEYALQFINISSPWKNLAIVMNSKAQDIKNELSLIIDRRNKIAHEADYDILVSEKYPIDRLDANYALHFIEYLCESIYKIAQNENA